MPQKVLYMNFKYDFKNPVYKLTSVKTPKIAKLNKKILDGKIIIRNYGRSIQL